MFTKTNSSSTNSVDFGHRIDGKECPLLVLGSIYY